MFVGGFTTSVVAVVSLALGFLSPLFSVAIALFPPAASRLIIRAVQFCLFTLSHCRLCRSSLGSILQHIFYALSSSHQNYVEQRK